MIFDAPKFRPLGDAYLGVEFGDEADLRLSFRVIALMWKIEAARIPGVIECQATMRQLGVIFDRVRMTHAAVQAAVEELLPEALADTQLRSRQVTLPTWYDDPFSAQLAERFEVPNNLAFVAERNGLTVAEAIERHEGAEHWTSLVGFAPGLPNCTPLDRSAVMSAPKYEVPRTYTPARSVVLAGAATAIHPVPGPGGYQVIGRTAVEVYDKHARLPGLGEDGVLLRAGDRLRFRSVGPLEYEQVREQVRAGTYEPEITDGVFDTAAYLAAQAAAPATTATE